MWRRSISCYLLALDVCTLRSRWFDSKSRYTILDLRGLILIIDLDSLLDNKSFTHLVWSSDSSIDFSDQSFRDHTFLVLVLKRPILCILSSRDTLQECSVFQYPLISWKSRSAITNWEKDWIVKMSTIREVSMSQIVMNVRNIQHISDL